MSGYVDDRVLAQGIATAEIAFLQKLFSREQPAERVRAVL
jgi:hypothetical protein